MNNRWQWHGMAWQSTMVVLTTLWDLTCTKAVMISSNFEWAFGTVGCFSGSIAMDLLLNILLSSLISSLSFSFKPSSSIDFLISSAIVSQQSDLVGGSRVSPHQRKSFSSKLQKKYFNLLPAGRLRQLDKQHEILLINQLLFFSRNIENLQPHNLSGIKSRAGGSRK